ncbi:MAG: LemA family protein [Flavobacteriales bacterium]|nr:LemA family protein [Flavobacteriales bacterium]
MNTRKTLFIALGVLLLIVGMLGCSYNNMVNREEKVESAWAQVETQYQRRADLIPNLVNTVKGAADFEQETLTRVVEARAAATSIKLNADDLTPENLRRFQEAQDQLSGALSRLLVIVERYPDIKANQNFRDLQVQLEGTENRIATARKDFNDAVMAYNAFIRRFPNNLIAGLFGFEKRGYFEASEGAERVPEVKF